MLWVVLFFLIFLSIPAYLITQGNRDALMDAMAMHERLQRTDPEDPLAQLGPTEFQRAYERAAKSRGKPMIKGMSLGVLAGIFLGFVFGFIISYMLDDVDMMVPVYGLTLLGCMGYGSWRGASKRLSVFDEMRKQLHLQ